VDDRPDRLAEAAERKAIIAFLIHH